jgi:hypothetical protein
LGKKKNAIAHFPFLSGSAPLIGGGSALAARAGGELAELPITKII